MPPVARGTPVAEDMHATVQDEIQRIESLQKQLQDRKEELARNANRSIPLPTGVCLVWEHDLVNECEVHVWKNPPYRWDKTFQKCGNCGLYYIFKVEEFKDNEYNWNRVGEVHWEKYTLTEVEHKACPICKA